jgi:eukaryotic-like serine/threonine-protein kinase
MDAHRSIRRIVDAKEARKMATQLIKAVAHLHCRGVVHRDIKSENIMVSAAGRHKLMDLGVARVSSF